MVRGMLAWLSPRLGVLSTGLALLATTACAPPPSAASPPTAAPSADRAPAPAHAASPTDGDADKQLAEVAAIHGGAGPWAVLGYRMGRAALAELKLPRGSFALEVRHESPRTPQYACVADGAQAATGASLGKVNLSLVEADEAHIQTRYRNKTTGQTLTLRPTAAFRARFLNVPREKLRAAGAEVLTLPDGELFEVAPTIPAATAGSAPAPGPSAPPPAPPPPPPPAPPSPGGH
jgi:formylmethanofuran dehydrogenase subunit E